MTAFLGACSSTTGGLDVIATDLTTTSSGGGASVAQDQTRTSSEAKAEAATDAKNADAVAAVETVAASAVPTPRPGVTGGPVEVPVTAFVEQKPSAPLTTALESAPAGGKVGSKVAPNSPELHALISRYAAHYQVPESLVRRVVKRESNFDPSARNKIYWGLMQIRHDTARTMGYRGSPEGLLDAETNLKYAVKYLRGAYITAGGNEDLAVRYYSRGYYYDAKRKGLLKVTGLRP